MTVKTAKVEVLTAELDHVDPGEIEPFGRIHDPRGKSDYGAVAVVGESLSDGSLVTAIIYLRAPQRGAYDPPA